MSITDVKKVDFLWKRAVYGMSETEPTALLRDASQELYGSLPPVIPTQVWTQASSLAIPAGATTAYAQRYVSSGAGSDNPGLLCTVDPSTAGKRTWFATNTPGVINSSTMLKGWVPTSIDPSYAITVYEAPAASVNPQADGTVLPQSQHDWVFDYNTGILVFPNTVPTNIASGAKSIFIEGWRYIGTTGVGGGGSYTFNTGTSGTNFTINNQNPIVTFNIPDAGLLARGLVTTSAQSFAGQKTFNSGLISNAGLSTTAGTINLTASSMDVSPYYITIGKGSINDGKDRGTIYEWFSGGINAKRAFVGVNAAGELFFIPHSSVTAGIVSGTSGDIRAANFLGNATTATSLSSSKKINGVVFNATADITVADATKEPVITKLEVERGGTNANSFSHNAIIKNTNSLGIGTFAAAIPDQDYLPPTGDGSLLYGITTSQITDINNLTTYVKTVDKGVAEGVASLDIAGKVPTSQLPSYVDDVLEYANLAAFPLVGEVGKIYVAIDTTFTYRWSGSIYVQIDVGAVTSVASRIGDVVLTKTDVGLANVDNTTDLSKPISTLTQTALNLKANLAGPTFTGTVVLPATTSITGVVSQAQFGYLTGVTSAIQTQIDSKLSIASAPAIYATLVSPTFTGTVVLPATTSIGTVSAAEIAFLDSVTSSIQTQLNSKEATITTLSVAKGGTGVTTSTGTGNTVLSDSPALVTPDIGAATGTSFNGLTGLSSQLPEANGVAAIGIATTAARADHVHDGASTLDAIGDVTITANSAGEILKWNGSAWINNTLAEAGIQAAGSYLTGNETITLIGDASGSGTTSINVVVADDSHNHSSSTGDFTVGNDLFVTGDMTVYGVTTHTTEVNLEVSNPTITLAAGTVSDDGKDRGIQFEWYSGSTKSGYFGFDRSTGYLIYIPDATDTSGIFSGTLGDIQATNFRGALIGNATTATALAVPRTISITGDLAYTSAAFDGSGNVTAAGTLANSGVVLGTYNDIATEVRPFTVDVKGRITSVGAGVTITPSWASITGTPTTILGYGLTDAAPISSPAFTEIPTAPTAAPSTNTTQIATTAFVINEVSGFEGAFGSGTTAQYLRGDKTWQTLDADAVGLTNVENVALSTWAGSSSLITAGALVADSLEVTGDLTVNGTTTTLNTANLVVEDKNIEINKGGTTAGTTGAGINILGSADALVGYIKVDDTLNTKIAIKAPGSTGILKLSLGSITHDLTLPLDTGTNGQVLATNGSGTLDWVDQSAGGVTTLDGLTDATITTPAKNQTLIYNGTQWVNAAAGTSFVFSIATFTCNFGVTQNVLMGTASAEWKAIGALSFSATYNNGPATNGYVVHSGWTNLTLTGGSYLGPTVSTIAATYPTAVGLTKVFTLTATDGSVSPTSAITYTFLNLRFWGVSANDGIAPAYDEAFVEGLSNSELSNSGSKTFTLTAGPTEYIIFASRTALGARTFTVNGFTGGFEAPQTVSVTNTAGFTENYYVYRSTNLNLGATTVVVS